MFVKTLNAIIRKKEKECNTFFVKKMKNNKNFSFFIYKQNIIVKYDENYRVRLTTNEIRVLKKERKSLYNDIRVKRSCVSCLHENV